MIYEKALIVSDKGNNVLRVKVDRHGACDACQLKSGCGQKLLTDYSSKNCIEFDAHNALDAAVGDVVELGIEEDALIKASLLTYMLPLVSMLLLAILFDYLWGPSDGISIAGGLMGLFAGFIAVHKLSKNLVGTKYRPSLVRILPR